MSPMTSLRPAHPPNGLSVGAGATSRQHSPPPHSPVSSIAESPASDDDNDIANDMASHYDASERRRRDTLPKKGGNASASEDSRLVQAYGPFTRDSLPRSSKNKALFGLGEKGRISGIATSNFYLKEAPKRASDGIMTKKRSR
ncbi:hypothetical protein HDU83_004121 [Entophlyctis luteolus]|nr:hypothetical protein HDU83_004121 [Entophlyctis luteolus]